MTPLLLGIGLFGILGISILFPLLALAVRAFQPPAVPLSTAPHDGSLDPWLLEVIIPARNEAKTIGITLESILRSIEYLQISPRSKPLPRILIHVGADNCTDQTAQIARRFPGVLVTKYNGQQGKWGTLETLCCQSHADWIVLTDCGAIWPEKFLAQTVPLMEHQGNTLALAPRYRPLKAGWLHQTVWKVEASLKRLEALCGGPISLHGATVLYKAFYLKEAMIWLNGTNWINDDVVLPLTLRALFPDGTVRYPVGEVMDIGVHPYSLDTQRRRRLVLGNLQWMHSLLPFCFRRNPVAGLISLRRMFRLLWAYWIGCILAAIAGSTHALILPAAAIVAILTLLSGSVRQLVGAAFISLLAPFQISARRRHLREAWQ